MIIFESTMSFPGENRHWCIFTKESFGLCNNCGKSTNVDWGCYPENSENYYECIACTIKKIIGWTTAGLRTTDWFVKQLPYIKEALKKDPSLLLE